MAKVLEIKTISDVNKIKGKYPGEFQVYIKEYFRQLWENLSETDEKIEDFNLSNHGHIVIIEDEKDLANFKDVIFIPEFVNYERLDNGYNFYWTGILYNNDYMMIFMANEEVVAKSDKILEWIKNNI